jgi:hypothetical protein
MRTNFRTLISTCALAALLLGAGQAALAEAVDGTWENADGQGDGPFSCLDPNAGSCTNSNTFVVGENPDSVSFNSGWANGEMIFSPFTEMTLDSAGDKIVFTGTVTLSSTNNSPLNSATPRTQFRFGLFDGDTFDELGWVGYYMSNKHGDPGTPSGTLAVKPVGNTSAFLSVTGQTTLTSVQGDGTEASRFNDGTYNMMLSIERNAAGELLVNSSLIGEGNRVALRGDFNDDDLIDTADYVIWAKGGPIANDVTPAEVTLEDYDTWVDLFGGPPLNEFSQVLSSTHTTASTTGTYTFDRLGFLTGANLGADKATYSNLDVTFTAGGSSSGGSPIPEPSTSNLIALAALAVAGRRPRWFNRTLN